MTIKALFLDVDDTLMDFMSMKKKAVRATIHALIDYGLDMDFNEAYEKMMEIYWKMGIESNVWIGEFLKEVEGKIDDIKLIAGIHSYRRVRNTYLHPYPTVYSTLIKLIKKGIKLAVVSDAPKDKVLARLETGRLIPFFDAIIPDAEKPDPKGFIKAMDLLGVQPSEVIMVGDRPEKDHEGAKNSKIKFCYASYASRFEKPEDINYEINRFDKILEIIEKENNK